MKIEIEHVSKKIKDALVLDDVCMTLESGNIYGFKGVNGSGKTMLMRAVSGLMYPTSGTISIDGKVLGKNMAFPERIHAFCIWLCCVRQYRCPVCSALCPVWNQWLPFGPA